MKKSFPFRQVHLDYHTSEHIPGIGADFDRGEFQQTLKTGHVSSITVFAKCHHGNFYYPSEKFATHPHLDFDILREMIDACHEIGVNAPVYISAGFDEQSALAHPEWLRVSRDRGQSFMQSGYHLMCYNTPYLDLLCAQTEEVVRRYPDADGIFFDISAPRTCWCPRCIAGMQAAGLDPENEADAAKYGEQVYFEYVRRTNAAVHDLSPEMRIFHNAGHIRRGRRDLAACNTHLELESLPTGGWGYDHFPLSMRYSQGLGMEALGMTGKFHTTWGEFGGFKHPNALIYETALSVAMGAKCSVGDQFHPRGRLCPATYELIGPAYARIEALEPWCDGVESVADVGLLSQESVGQKDPGDRGANRILLEGKFLYDVLDAESDFSRYKVIILPDSIRPEGELLAKLKAFTAAGGKLLCTGSSGMDADGNFLFDLGAKDARPAAHTPAYLLPGENYDIFSAAPFVVYRPGWEIKATGEVLAERAEPYFDRSPFHFSSHQHTPDDPTAPRSPAVTEGGEGIYVAWPLFEEYFRMGAITTQRMLLRLLDRLLSGKKTLETDLPAQGIVTLQHQTGENRYVCHLLYAIPVRRGEKTEIIEDIPTVADVSVTLRLPDGRRPAKIYLAPTGEELPFAEKEGKISFVLPRLWCHAAVVIE